MDRIRHIRGALLLTASSALVFWVISFWLPLPEYLVVLSSLEYQPYEFPLKLFVALYLIFFFLNFVIAGLYLTRLSSKVKFYLALVPAVLLAVGPVSLTIPIALQFPDRNFFEVFQAMYRLFRFTKVETFSLALLLTFLAVALNIYAAVRVRKTAPSGNLPANLRTRYLVYSAVVALLAGGFTAVNAYNSSLRWLDRSSCEKYVARELPKLDDEVQGFLSDVMLYGQSSGTKQAQEAFVTFSMLSRQYYALLDAGDSAALQMVESQVAAAKAKLDTVCSEFATR